MSCHHAHRINGNKYPPETSATGFEQHTCSALFATLFRLGQINSIDKATKNIINAKHLFQHGVKEGLGYDKNHIYNSGYNKNFYSRIEFVVACARLYSLTNDEMWIRMGLQYFEAFENLLWETYGPASIIDLDTVSISNHWVPEWLSEFGELVIAYEKKNLMDCPIDSFGTVFINSPWL